MCVRLCVCVGLFCLTDVPSLQGPVIKPLCTQPQTLAHIYLLYWLDGGLVHKHTHRHTRMHTPTVFP